MYDVEPHLYSNVIREMIRHENDVTNHRLMWLLIVQGLIANAYVNAGKREEEIAFTLAPVGILVTLSAFVLLYKSYQARGYLRFLGEEAKKGTLPEQSLPLVGWPPRRVGGWRQRVWICPWLGRVSDLLEPYLFLPSLLILAWIFVILHHWMTLGTMATLVLSAVVVAAVLFLFCVSWVWAQTKDEEP